MSDETGEAARPTTMVVLAAGMGTRMRSSRPKVLHRVAGRSMLGHVLATIEALGASRVAVVVGHEAEAVASEARRHAPEAAIALQQPQLGTAHAVRAALEAMAPLDAGLAPGVEADLFVLYGDTPLLRPETLERLRAARASGAGVAVLGFEAADPTGYGRLALGADGGLERIVEERDATEAERAIRLSNSGVMAIDARRAAAWIARIGDANAKREFYLTDIVAIARADGARAAVVVGAQAEMLGVNDRADLAAAEAAFQARARAAALTQGVSMPAPETVWLSYDTRLGRDVTIEPNVVIGPGVTLGEGAVVKAFSHLEGAWVGEGVEVGPFARLRPGARLEAGARVGNFVEVKAATLGVGAKASHLSYIGDAEIGAGANIGAGTITCNYDGYLKHRTTIGEGAFIGSNTALVAPVSVGANAIVGAGSTITEDVPADALAIARARQATRPGLAARLREALAEAKRALKGGR